MAFWSSRDFPAAPARGVAAWPGWRVAFHADRFEAQLEQIGNQLQFNLPNRAQQLELLRGMLVKNDGSSPAESVEQIGELIGGQLNAKVSVNPDALSDARLMLTLEEKAAIFDAAVSAVAGDQGSLAQ